MGGVDILSSTGLALLTIGILFTVGIPLTMILKGKTTSAGLIFHESIAKISCEIFANEN